MQYPAISRKMELYKTKKRLCQFHAKRGGDLDEDVSKSGPAMSGHILYSDHAAGDYAINIEGTEWT